jgi:carbon monoxide dehydrogenase subunit G
MEMKGSGAIKIDMPLDVPALNVSMSGACTITLKGRSDSASVKASGASTYKAEDFQVNMYQISMSGAGTANIYVVDEMSVSMSGAGKLQYKGDPQKTHINISGAGSVSKL